MPPDRPTASSIHTHPGILWLVIGHIVLGWMGADIAYSAGRPPTLWTGAFVGLMLSQTSLLGVWGSLGTSPSWKRVIGVVVGIGYIVPILGIGIYEVNTDTFVIVGVVASFVAIPLLIVRFFRIVTRLDDSPVAPVGRIQFSIRHVMVLTFVVACLTSIGRLVQPMLFHGQISDFFFVTLPFAVVGILPVWFVLATKWPNIFSIGVVAVGAGAGYCYGWKVFGDEKIWVTATATEAAAVVVSLLVVRSCGYRLVRLASGLPEKKPAGEVADFDPGPV